MNKERFLNTGLLEQYVLGLTDAEESKVVEQYLEAFPELKQEVHSMQNALENYAKQYAITPPQNLKNQILDGIEEEPATPVADNNSHQPAVRKVPWARIFSYAALLALVVGYFYQAQRYNRANAQLNSKNTLLAECKSQNAALEESQKVYAFISNTNTQPVLLSGTPVSPESEAVVYWNESEQNAYFFASKLPEPPQDKQYQIWADVEGEMISIGLLDYQTNELQQINYIANAESLNITLEPKGGSEHPNVEQLFVNAALTI